MRTDRATERLETTTAVRHPWSPAQLLAGLIGLFMTVLGETHSAGHQFLHGVLPSHPLGARPLTATAGVRLDAVYRAIDDAVERLLAVVGDDATVMLFAVHGMRRNGSDTANVWLPELLHRMSTGRPLIDFGAWDAAAGPVELDPEIGSPRLRTGFGNELWGIGILDEQLPSCAMEEHAASRTPGTCDDLLPEALYAWLAPLLAPHIGAQVPPAAAMGVFPLLLVPTFAVPLGVMLHVFGLIRLAGEARLGVQPVARAVG